MTILVISLLLLEVRPSTKNQEKTMKIWYT